MKDILELVDRKTLGMASIAVAVIGLLFALAAFFTRDTVLDYIVNDVYHVSGNIEKRLGNEFSQGYGRTFVFDEYHEDAINREVPQALLFHMSPSQDATLILTSAVFRNTSTKPIPVTVKVDNTTVHYSTGERLEVPLKLPLLNHLDKSEFIKEESLPGEAHALYVTPEPHDGKAVIVIDALLLVAPHPK